MFDYHSIVTDSELTVKFESDANNSSIINAYNDGNLVGFVTINGATFEASSDDIFIQYKLWQTRPERTVGRPVTLIGKNMEQLIDAYEELFIGAYILTQNATVMKGYKSKFEIAIDWLRTTDFYTAPASTKYHEAIPGGLLVHTLRVYNEMVKLHKIDEFNKVDIAKATIAALVHDWCKIGYYESYQKNVKDDATGQWRKETAYTVNQKGLPFGHGTTSMYIAMKLLRLTEEQALAVRWHMGAWHVTDVEKSELQKANTSYPMVYLIQFADQLACTDYEIDV